MYGKDDDTLPTGEFLREAAAIKRCLEYLEGAAKNLGLAESAEIIALATMSIEDSLTPLQRRQLEIMVMPDADAARIERRPGNVITFRAAAKA